MLTLPIRISAFLTGPRSPGKWWIRNSAHVYLILLYLVAVLDPPLGSALPTGLGDKWTLPWSSGIHTSLTVLIVLPRVGAVHSVTSVICNNEKSPGNVQYTCELNSTGKISKNLGGCHTRQRDGETSVDFRRGKEGCFKYEQANKSNDLKQDLTV